VRPKKESCTCGSCIRVQYAGIVIKVAQGIPMIVMVYSAVASVEDHGRLVEE
jgi:hypothetical protein